MPILLGEVEEFSQNQKITVRAMRQLLGDKTEAIINELNEVLAA